MKPWISYGLRGMVICLILSLLYIALYSPMFERYQLSETVEKVSFFTGHGEIFLAAFLFHDLPWSICPKTEEHCFNWYAHDFASDVLPEGEECVPWMIKDEETGEKLQGCCVGLEKTASDKCTEPLEAAIGVFFLGMLFAIYFGGGVLYWWLRYGRKK